MQCQAKSKRTGQQCKRPAVPGKRVCHYHGGATPSGIASANFKHGRYSKAVPTRVLARYEQAMQDPELLELRGEIALVEARLVDLLNRVDTGEAGIHWRELRGQFRVLQKAIRDQDAAMMADALGGMDAIIKRGLSDYAAWDEVLRLVEQRRRLVESERKRLMDMQTMLNAEQARNLYTALAMSVRQHVTDATTLTRIQEDFIRLVGTGSGGSPETT